VLGAYSANIDKTLSMLRSQKTEVRSQKCQSTARHPGRHPASFGERFLASDFLDS
jgi:hypothetical protein